MLRLVLLGSLRLEDDDGPVTGRASQKRRLAILALLAVPPGHLVTRDKLIGYLWPESDDERARRSLSTALWELRRELGEDAIRAPGDELGLDPNLISSDAAAFLQAVEDDDPERAVELYGGPFLDGVHIGVSAEFEHWVDEERRRYAWQYREALERLARLREQEGDLQGAAGVWRRLATEDPYNKRIAMGYMRALEAAGDRARALEFVGVHTALLREEFDAEPDPEVTALAEQLRQDPAASPVSPEAGTRIPEEAAVEGGTEPPPASESEPDASAQPSRSGEPPAPAASSREMPTGGAPDGPRARRGSWLRGGGVILAIALAGVAGWWALQDPAPAPTEEIRLAVLPFQDPSDTTGMVDFADDLADAISGALGQVGGFLLTGRTSVRALEGSDARSIARQLNVQYLLGGDIAREGQTLRIRVWVVDALDTQRWQAEYDRRLGSLMEVERDVAEKVVEGVAGELAGVRIGEDDLYIGATTEDTAALRHFRAARRAWNTRTPAGLAKAKEELERAVTVDPSYARAHAALADVFNTMGAYEYGMLRPESAYPLARASALRALDLQPELPEARAALGVALFNHYWEWGEAERQLRAAIETLPSDVMTRHWYAWLLRVTGRPAEAIRQVRYAQERDPESAVVGASLCRHYYFDGDLPRSAAACQDALALDPGHVMAYLALALTRVQQGEYGAAMDLYSQADSLLGGPTPAISGLRAHALGSAGDTAAAAAIYETLRQAAESSPPDRYVPPHFVALAAVGAGRLEEAIDWLARGLEERSPALIYMQIEPVIDPLRELPDYRRLLERASEAGLPLVGRAPVDG